MRPSYFFIVRIILAVCERETETKLYFFPLEKLKDTVR